MQSFQTADLLAERRQARRDIGDGFVSGPAYLYTALIFSVFMKLSACALCFGFSTLLIEPRRPAALRESRLVWDANWQPRSVW